MYFAKETFNNTPEFLASEKYINFTATLNGITVTADEHGKKIVPAGTLVDADGEVVTVTGTTPSSTPVGILFHTTDITHGPQPVALMVEGYIIAERLQGEDTAAYVATDAFKTALPEIKVR
ncbi:MAG: hypothetical protein E7211_20520 [Clostridium lundense]|nr:hypothetical protein [Clostridium lundense]